MNTYPYDQWTVRLVPGYYANGQKALELVYAHDGTPVTRPTHALPAAELAEAALAPDEVVVKEVGPGLGIGTWLEEHGIAERWRAAPAPGHYTAGFWVFRLTPETLALFDGLTPPTEDDVAERERAFHALLKDLSPNAETIMLGP